MSEQALITFNHSKTAVAAYGDDEQVKLEMRILRASVPGLLARKRAKIGGEWRDTAEYAVSDEQVLALYVAKRASGLMPERGELYAVPGLGVYVAAKVRANDAVTQAARRGETLSIIFRSLNPARPTGSNTRRSTNWTPPTPCAWWRWSRTSATPVGAINASPTCGN